MGGFVASGLTFGPFGWGARRIWTHCDTRWVRSTVLHLKQTRCSCCNASNSRFKISAFFALRRMRNTRKSAGAGQSLPKLAVLCGAQRRIRCLIVKHFGFGDSVSCICVSGNSDSMIW